MADQHPSYGMSNITTPRYATRNSNGFITPNFDPFGYGFDNSKEDV